MCEGGGGGGGLYVFVEGGDERAKYVIGIFLIHNSLFLM